jgi:hypothetical protein
MGTSRRPLLLAAMLALFLALLPSLAHALAKQPFSDLVALDDQRLDQLRGGIAAGDFFAFVGFERRTTVGQETFVQSFVITDLVGLIQGRIPGIQITANLGQVIQTGPGNFVGSAPQTDARAQALQQAQPASANTTAPAPAAASPPAAPAASGPAASSTPTQVASAAASPPAATSGAAPNTAAAPAAATPSAAPAAAATSPAAAPASAATASTPVSASAAPASASTTAPAAAAPAPAAAPATASLTQPVTIHTAAGSVTMNLPNTLTIVQNTQNNVRIAIEQALTIQTNALAQARALVLSGQARLP